MSTYAPKAGDVDRKWYVIDATDVVLGRLAVQTANLLRGKNKPTYAPNVDGGDFVVIINAEKIAVSANKRDKVKLYRHSGYPGGAPAVPAPGGGGRQREREKQTPCLARSPTQDSIPGP